MKRCALFLLLAAFCLSLAVPPSVLAQDSIKVGIVVTTTGAKAKFGEIMKRSFDMALEKINAEGGVKGKKIEFLFEDDTGRPEQARSSAEKLITKDKVVMLTGGYASSETFAIAGVAQQNRFPFLVSTGSDDKITEKGWDYVFRVSPPTSEYSTGLESFLKDVVKPKSAAVLYENTNFGSAGFEEFKQIAERLGIKVVVAEGYEAGGIDFKPILVKVKNTNPDLVYMISYIMDASLLMRQASELRLKPQLFAGAAAGFTLPEFTKNAGKASEKIISATLWYQTLPYPGATEYYDAYVKRHGSPPSYHGAEAYAAAMVTADVLKRTASFSPEDIKKALAATDLMTVFGKVKFENYGNKTNQNRVTTYVTQWIDGKLELVWPKDAATKPYVFPVDWEKEWK